MILCKITYAMNNGFFLFFSIRLELIRFEPDIICNDRGREAVYTFHGPNGRNSPHDFFEKALAAYRLRRDQPE